MTRRDPNDWFAPKRFGYGAGRPIAWQGWAAIGLHSAACIAAAALFVPRHIGVFVAILAIATVPLILVSAQHTRGGWKWRWGDE